MSTSEEGQPAQSGADVPQEAGAAAPPMPPVPSPAPPQGGYAPQHGRPVAPQQPPPGYGVPAAPPPAYGAPAYGAPAYGAPAYGAPAYGAPANSAPAYVAPADGAPANGAQAYGPQAYGAPAYGAPGYPQPGYPQPGYPQPGYPQPGYPQPGYPQPGYYAPPKPSTGVLPWAMGFLIFIPIPVLGALIAGVVMPSVRGTTLRGGEVARENGRSAANWGLTFLLVSTGLLVLHLVVVLFAALGAGGSGSFYPIGIPVTLYALVCLLHVVLTIIGTVRAASGQVMRVPFAIPFLRS